MSCSGLMIMLYVSEFAPDAAIFILWESGFMLCESGPVYRSDGIFNCLLRKCGSLDSIGNGKVGRHSTSFLSVHTVSSSP